MSKEQVSEKELNDESQPAVLTAEQIEAQKTEIHTILKSGLGCLARTNDNRSYAYVDLKVPEKELTSIHGLLIKFPHIRYLDLSKNKLTDVSSVSSMIYLRDLNLSENALTQVDDLIQNAKAFHHLEVLNLSGNQLTSFSCKGFKDLQHLNINNNKLVSLDCSGQNMLKTLEARGNQLSQIKNVNNCLKLQNLYLAQNKIESLSSFAVLPPLKRLHLRENLISGRLAIADDNLRILVYLNIRGNKIASWEDIRPAFMIPNLDMFNFLGNPFLEGIEENPMEMLFEKMILIKYSN